MKLLSVLLLLVTSGSTLLLADAAKLYVSPQGNNSWSGKLEQRSADGQDGPKATLAAALDTARSLRKSGQAGDGIAIYLRGGFYPLAEPVRVTSEDSGMDAQHPLLIAAYGNEKPVLSGGQRLIGWQKVEGRANLWRVELPEVREGKWYFHQLFINGERKQRARTPNEGFFRIQGASPQDKPVKLKFAGDDIKKTWADDGDVEVIALLAWADIRMQIRAVDEQAHVATLSGDPRPSNREDNARYFIENAPDALDAAGEWYLNRKTGELLYQGAPGEDLSQAEVIAPRLHGLVLLQGDFTAKKSVHNVTFYGLTFSHTDWELGEHGYADTQAAIATYGDVRAEAAVECVLEDCSFAHLAGYAV
jgi:hypothetical protein